MRCVLGAVPLGLLWLSPRAGAQRERRWRPCRERGRHIARVSLSRGVSTVAEHPDQHSIPPRRRRALGREEAAALGAIALCVLLLAFLLPVGVDDLDEGYFAEQATRVLRGELPYRDFETFYTPGLLYTHAALFAMAGEPSVLLMRAYALASRAALAFGLYALARPLARPLFAAAPPLLLLLGLDAAPDRWQTHPGWQGALGTVAAAWLVGGLPGSGHRTRRLVLAGGAVGLAFAYKQNAGVFAGAASAGFLLLQGIDVARRPASPWLTATRVVGLVATLAAVGWLIRPFASVGVVAYLLVPMATVGLLLADLRTSRRGQRFGEAVRPLIPLAGGFALTTLPWVLAVLIAVQGRLDRLAGFVGAVDQAALFYPLELPTGAAWSIAGLAGVALLVPAAGRRTRLGFLFMATSLGLLMLALTWPRGTLLPGGVLQAPGRAGQGLALLLPPLSLLAGAWLARRPALTRADWLLRWYLALGAFMLLAQYPRMDLLHLAWSAPLALVVGAVALDRLHTYLGRVWRLGLADARLLGAALLVVSLFAALPTLNWRARALFQEDPRTGLPRLIPLVPLEGVAHAEGLLVTAEQRDELAGIVSEIQRRTVPGEPIFVYPTSPLLYVVAERPNPTRYAHLYPGAATAAQIQELIRTLDAAPVRVVVISDLWYNEWGRGEANQPLEAYLASQFQERARSGTYRLLERRPSLP